MRKKAISDVGSTERKGESNVGGKRKEMELLKAVLCCAMLRGPLQIAYARCDAQTVENGQMRGIKREVKRERERETGMKMARGKGRRSYHITASNH